MDFSRRSLLHAGGPVAAGLWLALAFPARGAAQSSAITPEQFGAKGDGRADDSDAFAAMAALINARGGGEVVLRRTIYRVGRQVQAGRNGAPYAFEPAPILELTGLGGPLVIRGNGAVLRCAPGLRYGTFDPVSGTPTDHPMPYIRSGELATPYRAMIKIENCRGPIEIGDLELDGNLDRWIIGGSYGDTGRQIQATGLMLINNRGPERIVGVHSHHHGLDGIMIDGFDGPRPAPSILEKVRSEYNGRQGLSIVGGLSYAFRDCRFAHTGRSKVSSAPGAGVDIEAEAGKRVRDLSFEYCTFDDNAGAGMVADSGDSEGAAFRGCTFIGATNWAAWPNKPRFRFDQCRFVGAITRGHGDADPARATQFHDCSFRDDPALSPSGKVYGGVNPDRPIADLPSNLNLLFNRCKFLLTHRAALPWTTNVTYADCEMSQASPNPSYPRGFYEGRTIISGMPNISGSLIRGELIVNGKRLPRGRI